MNETQKKVALTPTISVRYVIRFLVLLTLLEIVGDVIDHLLITSYANLWITPRVLVSICVTMVMSIIFWRVSQRTTSDQAEKAVTGLNMDEMMKLQEQYDQVVSNLELVVWSMDATTNKLTHISETCEKLYGVQPNAFFEDEDFWKKVIHQEDRPFVEGKELELLAGRSIQYEYRLHHLNGAVKWVSDYTVPVYNAQNKLVRYDGIIYEITQRKRSEEMIKYLSYHDSLSGLSNQRMFKNGFTTEVIRHEENEGMFALLLIDIDSFRQVNNLYSIAIGDLVLQFLAERLSVHLKPENLLARINGDGFALILPDLSHTQESIDVARSIQDCISLPIEVDDQTIHLTASIGVSVYPDHGTDYESLLKSAKHALDVAKARGNSYQVYDAPIRK